MKKHYHWLDLLRFLAAFEVVAFHFRGNFFVEYGLLPPAQMNVFTTIAFFFTRLGQESVIIFFVMSGFLVGGKAIERILNNDVNLKAYVLDRFVRIMLPLLASIVLVLLVDLITGAPVYYIDIIGSLFSLQGIFTTSYNNNPVWSLAYEVWFYVLMGCIMALCRLPSPKTSLVCLFVISLIFLIFTKLNPNYLFIWFMGALTYLLPKPSKPWSKWLFLPILGLLFVCMAMCQLTSKTNTALFNLSFLNHEITVILLGLATCLLVYCIIYFTPTNKIAIKIDKLGSELSKFSYSLYLTHYPIMYLLIHFGFPKSKAISIQSVSWYFLELSIAMVVAYLAYLLSEKHTNTVKKAVGNWLGFSS